MSDPVTLIDVAALVARPAAQVLVVDCRFDLADPAAAEQAYRRAHIPAAVYAHLDRDLADLSLQASGNGRHPLPTAAAFSATLARWRWQAGQTIVAYDDAGGVLAAARLWWLGRLAGIASVAVLDGGIGAWQRAGLPLQAHQWLDQPQTGYLDQPSELGRAHAVDAPLYVSDGAALPAPTAPAPALRSYDVSMHLDHQQLQQALSDPATLLLDARASPRYRGDIEPIDRLAGHVPGAINRPFSENLQADGRFKPAAQLREAFSRLLGSRLPSQVIHMCGSGVTACHNLLAMEHAGLHGSRLYAPSWSGWISDAARPVARG